MKRGSQLTLKIDGIKFPSTGISECEGKKVYVKGAFPGQVVKGTIKKKRDTYAEAKLVEVIEKAEYVAKSVCVYKNENYSLQDRKFDKILTSKKTGIPIMLLFLGLIFWITISGANYPSQALSCFFGFLERKLISL